MHQLRAKFSKIENCDSWVLDYRTCRETSCYSLIWCPHMSSLHHVRIHQVREGKFAWKFRSSTPYLKAAHTSTWQTLRGSSILFFCAHITFPIDKYSVLLSCRFIAWSSKPILEIREEEKLKEPTYLLVQNGTKTILIRFLRSFQFFDNMAR